MKKPHDFLATIKDGGFNLGSDYNRAQFINWTRKHVGERVGISLLVPESSKQRGYFEGAICPMVAFFQEGLDHKNYEDVKTVREMLKIEFNGVYVRVGDKSTKIGGSTKGELNQGFLDRVVDWMEEQYGINRAEVLDPKEYKKWRDEIFPYGGPDTFIDYLVSVGKISVPEEKLCIEK